jgi:DNA-binding response OmpR family regulator
MNTVNAYYIGSDRVLLAMYTYILRQANYVVESTTDLADGYTYCQTHPPDILVLDHTIARPGLTTVEIYHQLRNMRATAELPILVIRCEWQQARQEYTTHADRRLGFLPIVFTVEEFLAAVEALVDI